MKVIGRQGLMRQISLKQERENLGQGLGSNISSPCRLFVLYKDSPFNAKLKARLVSDSRATAVALAVRQRLKSENNRT